MNAAEPKLREALEQSFRCMVLDNDYRSDLRPLNGNAPIRHQLAWAYARAAFGSERFDELLRELDGANPKDRGIQESWGRYEK